MSVDGENVITLQDEEGEEHNFTVIDIFPLDQTHYAILAPQGEVDTEGDDEDEVEAIIFRIVEEDENHQVFYLVDDDEEWDRVAAAWEDRAATNEEGIDVFSEED